MKNLLAAVLPALALFALGGCAGTSALTSTEDDGVYYSSKDRTTAVVRAAEPASAASTSEEANPDYNGSAASTAPSSSARSGNSSDEYYDNSYTYMRGVPGYGSRAYYGPGLATYVPYSPYTSFATVCTGYGPYGYGGCGFSPYAYGFADPFYSPFGDPFYNPYAYGFGPGVNISFGFGQPYYGGYYGYGRPYAYGGFYDPYFYGSPYYGGYYGRRGYYGNNYYGGRNGYGNGGYYTDNSPRRTGTVGRRADRSSDGRYSTGTAAPITTTGNGTSTGGGRVRDFRSNTGGEQPAEGIVNSSRAREEEKTVNPTATESYNKPRDIARDQRPYGQDQTLSEVGRREEKVFRDDKRRGRVADSAPENNQPDEVAQPQRRRGGLFQAPASQPVDDTRQPARQRSYEQPAQRTYEQSQRAVEQPQRTYSQPSYSAPSNNGGGGGGRRGRD